MGVPPYLYKLRKHAIVGPGSEPAEFVLGG
jgi:hypothetical protein